MDSNEMTLPPISNQRAEMFAETQSLRIAYEVTAEERDELIKENDSLRKLLFAILHQSGGEITLSSNTLLEVEFTGSIHTQHNLKTKSVQVWVT